MSLLAIFQEFNQQHFGSQLPLPKLSWNSRLSSSAGRFCPGSRNPLRPRPPEIEVATYLRELADGIDHIRDTILHEMVHYFLWHKGRPYGHTREFHLILKQVGASRYNPVPKLRAVKHWYECPSCAVVIPARRRIRDSACLKCCRRFNGGRYSEKFRLQARPAPAFDENGQPFVPQIRSASPAAREASALSPEEIIRRLEEIKSMIRQA